MTAIARTPVTTLKPEEISAEHASMKSRYFVLYITHALFAYSWQLMMCLAGNIVYVTTTLSRAGHAMLYRTMMLYRIMYVQLDYPASQVLAVDRRHVKDRVMSVSHVVLEIGSTQQKALSE